MNLQNKRIIILFGIIGLGIVWAWPGIVFGQTTCRGGAGATLGGGVNTGAYPEYYGIGKLADNIYPNSLTCTTSAAYTCPSGSTMKVFINYDTEGGWDFVRIYNGAGTLLESISGDSGTYVWKGPYSTNQLKFGFTSDSSITRTGFDIWEIECIAAGTTPPPSTPPPSGLLTSCNGRSTSSNTATLSPTTSWQTQSGSLASGSDTKRYQVDVSSTGTHDFSFCPTDGGSDDYDSWLCLFDSSGTSLASVDDVCENNAKISQNISSAGTYYIQVSGFSTSYGSYTLAYKNTAAPAPTPTPTPSFTSTCRDRVTSSNQATLSPETSWLTTSSSLSSGSDTKRYPINITTAGAYDFSLCPDNGGGSDVFDSYLCLLRSNGEAIIYDDDTCNASGAENNALIAGRSITSAGTYYIQVSGYSSADLGNYTLAYRKVPPLPSDTTAPTVGAISPTSAIVNTATTYSVSASDNINVTYCVFNVDGVADGNMSVPASCGPSGCTATYSKTFTSTGSRTVKAICGDAAGNYAVGTPVTVTVIGEPALTYPSNTWQRLWYATSGTSPDVSLDTFLGENTVSNIDNNWGTAQLYNTTAAGTDNGTSRIGFKSSKTINFPTGDLYRFTIGADDGARLYIDGALKINMWSNGGYRTQSADVSISAGNHTFQFDYYENTGDAKVSFSYALAPLCSVPTGLDCSTTTTSVLTGWTAVAGITNYRLEWKRNVDSAWLSATTSVSPYEITGLIPNTTYNVRVRGETDNNTQCNAPTGYSSTINCPTQNCTKTATAPTDSISVTVPTAQGTKSCSVSATHSGQDLYDSSGVKYETKASSPTTYTSSHAVEMDDDPVGSGDCDLDLLFRTEWGTEAGGKLNVYSVAEKKDTTLPGLFGDDDRDLSWQYQLSTSGCVIQGVVSNPTCASSVLTSGENACTLPAISVDKTTATKKHGIKEDYGSAAGTGYGGVHSDFKFTFVECTSNGHCTADPNTAKCNVGITTNFPQNTCIDSVAPTITIGEIKRTLPDPKVITNNWLKAGVYEVSISVADNAGGSGVDTTYRPVTIHSTGADKLFGTADDRIYSPSLISYNKFNVWVGPPENSLNDCVDQEERKCRVDITVRDNAGNPVTYPLYLNIDYTAPSAQ